MFILEIEKSIVKSLSSKSAETLKSAAIYTCFNTKFKIDICWWQWWQFLTDDFSGLEFEENEGSLT